MLPAPLKCKPCLHRVVCNPILLPTPHSINQILLPPQPIWMPSNTSKYFPISRSLPQRLTRRGSQCIGPPSGHTATMMPKWVHYGHWFLSLRLAKMQIGSLGSETMAPDGGSRWSLLISTTHPGYLGYWSHTKSMYQFSPLLGPC